MLNKIGVRWLFYLSALCIEQSITADTIYNCELIKTSTIAWTNDNSVSTPGLLAKVESAPRKIPVTFVVKKNGALLKGNMGQDELKKVGKHFYIETSGEGNVFLWSLIQGEDKIPTVLYQLKAYELAGPFSVTAAYQCN